MESKVPGVPTVEGSIARDRSDRAERAGPEGRTQSVPSTRHTDTSAFPAQRDTEQVRQGMFDSEVPSSTLASIPTTALPVATDTSEHSPSQISQSFQCETTEPAAEPAQDSASLDSSIHSNHHAPAMDGQNNKLNRKKKRKRPHDDPTKTSGRWTQQEHEAFLKGLATYGREWKRVAQHISTRTSAQVRSHAQKYLRKQEMLMMTQNQQLQHSGGDMDALMNYSHLFDDDNLSNPSHVSNDHDSQQPRPYESTTASLQLQVDRILAQPHAVARQVQDTLAALHERYRELQQQLQGMSVDTTQPSAEPAPLPSHLQADAGFSVSRNLFLPLSSEAKPEKGKHTGVPNEQELIALQVLHQKLGSSSHPRLHHSQTKLDQRPDGGMGEVVHDGQRNLQMEDSTFPSGESYSSASGEFDEHCGGEPPRKET